METFLLVLSTLAFFSALIFFVIFIIRIIKKKNKKQPGIIALVSFVILITVSIIGSRLYPVEDKETRLSQDASEDILNANAQEFKVGANESFKEEEIVILPKNGKKMKVMGTTLTFRIDAISISDSSTSIPLLASGEIPMDGMNSFVKMRMVVDKQIYESSNTSIKGLVKGALLDNNGMTGKGAMLQGYFVFEFPTTKMPNEIIVYNIVDSKSIKFKVTGKNN